MSTPAVPPYFQNFAVGFPILLTEIYSVAVFQIHVRGFRSWGSMTPLDVTITQIPSLNYATENNVPFPISANVFGDITVQRPHGDLNTKERRWAIAFCIDPAQAAQYSIEGCLSSNLRGDKGNPDGLVPVVTLSPSLEAQDPGQRYLTLVSAMISPSALASKTIFKFLILVQNAEGVVGVIDPGIETDSSD